MDSVWVPRPPPGKESRDPLNLSRPSIHVERLAGLSGDRFNTEWVTHAHISSWVYGR